VRIGLESGQLSTWLFHELKARRLPVISPVRRGEPPSAYKHQR
jgi:hypothetical protein